MPEALIKYVRYSKVRAFKKDSETAKMPDSLQKILILLRSQTGHDFSFYKKDTILRRIERRMGVHQVDKLSDYVRYMQEHPHEINLLFKEIIIGVTNFFRDKDAFDVLKTKVYRIYSRKDLLKITFASGWLDALPEKRPIQLL